MVEFGGGLGYVSRWATSVGATALGIDLSADPIEQAARLATARPNFASVAPQLLLAPG